MAVVESFGLVRQVEIHVQEAQRITMKFPKHRSQHSPYSDRDQSHLLPAVDTQPSAGHLPVWQQPMSRRRLLKTATGIAAASALGGAGAWGLRPTEAIAAGSKMPKPIPGGLRIFGELFHVYMPGVFASQDDEPSTITDFAGVIGLAVLQGRGTRTDKKTGATSRHPFEADIRFMKGLYKGEDKHVHQATFAMVSLRVFQAEMAHHIHHFNPGIAANGLVWTTRIPNQSILIDLRKGQASMQVTDLGVEDAFTFENALVGGGKTPIPAVVSYTVRWNKKQDFARICDKAQDFSGDFVRTAATVKWNGETKRFKYVSDASFTSHSTFAEVGFERNGVSFQTVCW
jgi:hypothetical protein